MGKDSGVILRCEDEDYPRKSGVFQHSQKDQRFCCVPIGLQELSQLEP